MKRVMGFNDSFHVIEYNREYWGIQYADGYATAWGYGPIEKAKRVDPQYCKKPEDATWKGSPDVAALRKGKIVPVRVYTQYQIG